MEGRTQTETQGTFTIPPKLPWRLSAARTASEASSPITLVSARGDAFAAGACARRSGTGTGALHSMSGRHASPLATHLGERCHPPFRARMWLHDDISIELLPVSDSTVGFIVQLAMVLLCPFRNSVGMPVDTNEL